MTKKIAIIQGEIPNYRIPFFNGLGNQPGIELSVIHSGKALENTYDFSEIRVSKVSISSFKFQFWGVKKLKAFDTIILPLDVTWLSTVLFCLLTKKRYLLWGHGLGKSSLANRVRKQIILKSSGVILYGDESVPEFDGIAKNVFVAPNTVDITNSGFEAAIDRYTFLYVGRAQPRKKINELIQAFAAVENQIPENIVIEIVGEEDKELVEIIETSKMEHRVNFLGKIYEDDMLKSVFQRALAYVSPGHVGLGVLHSFAYGIPVVTREISNHAPEFNNAVDGVNSILYDGSKLSLSNILLSLVNKPELSRTLGLNAYQWYRDNRSMTIMVGGFLKAIDHTV